MSLFGLGLNPIQDLAAGANYIGGLFGNNTSPTKAPNLVGNAPSIFQALNSNPTSAPTGHAGQGTGVYNGVVYPTTPGNSVNPNGTPTNNGYIYNPTSTSAPAGPAYSPQQAAMYDLVIGNTQSAIDRLPNQLNIGNQNIDTGYQQSLNPLNLQKSTSTRNYDNSTTQNQQSYQTNKNAILDNSHAALTSLMRLLGSRGAGGSSDYLQAAPNAVSLQATQQRAGAGQTYAQNQQGLDTNYNDFLTGWNNAIGNLGQQRDQQKQSLQGSIDTNRASLLQTLADLQGAKAAYAGGNYAQTAQPYLDQANGLLSTADNLGQVHPTFTPQTVAYNAPSLASYNPGQFSAIQGQNPNASQSSGITPSLSLLLGAQKDKNLNNIGV